MKLLIPVQGVIATIALVALALWPPATGNMMLVPVRGMDVNGVARVALAGGAVLLGTGPLPGSLVVIGDRSRIARQNESWRVMILAAPSAGCGTVGSHTPLI